jgi:hypothetical protein
MTTRDNVAKCLECGHVDESKNFSVLIASEMKVRLCPHCRAGESSLLDDLQDYVLHLVMGNLRSFHYTVINNEFGHFAVADRVSGTRLTTWGSHAHVIDEFCATERKVSELSGEHDTREHAIEPGAVRIREQRCIPRTGTDRRLFSVPVPGRPQTSRAEAVVNP